MVLHGLKRGGDRSVSRSKRALRQLPVLSLVCVWGLFCLPVQLPAQDAPPPSSTSVEGSPIKLDELTVTGEPEYGYRAEQATTATKVETPLLETPLSIQVVPRAVLDDQQVIRLSDALKNVSGVYQGFNNGLGELSYTLRGFGQNFLYEDGFRIPSLGFVDTAHLERVEVLKGPAAVLYGRVEPGGLINVVTKKPLDQPFYSLQQQFGSFDLYRTSLDATGPLSPNRAFLYRFNLAYENSGSFQDFIHLERIFLAPVVTWNPSSRTQATLEFQYQHQDNPRNRGIPAIGDRPADVPRSRFLGEPDFNSHTEEDKRVGFLWSHRFNDTWQLRHKFKANFRDATVRVVEGLAVRSDNRTLVREANFSRSDVDTYFTNAELIGEFSTWGVEHTLLCGADYYNDTFTQQFLIANIPPRTSIDIFDPVYTDGFRPRFPATPATTRKERWYGLYCQEQLELPYRVHVLGGLRYDDTKQGGQKNTDLSPRVALLWQPLPWLSLYGNWTESFSAFNNFGLRFDGNPLEPETGTQYEAGLKVEVFGGRLLASLAYYEITKRNITIEDPAHPGFVLQLGEAKSKGIEFDTSGQVTDELRLTASYAYTDTKILKSNPREEGNRLPNAPLNGASFWASYEFLRDSWRGLQLGAGIFAVGRRKGDVANTFELPGYLQLDLMAAYTWQWGDLLLTAQLNLENLLDKKYVASASFRESLHFGRPRSFIGSLRLEF